MEDQAVAYKFREILFEDGYTAKEVVGQSVQTIADLAGVEIPENTRVIVINTQCIGFTMEDTVVPTDEEIWGWVGNWVTAVIRALLQIE